MTDYTSFFLNNHGGAVVLECLEITHPSFNEPARFIKNDTDGVIAEGQSYEYQPMSIKRNNVSNDLEQQLSITLADMEDHFFKQVINTMDSNTRPSVVFKLFSDQDLEMPLMTMQKLEIASLSKDSAGLATFDAQAPELNSVKTGRIYTLEDFPLLQGI
ncbi:DUF1833 family protein [Acinetobacter johnsonii]|uniref:DUF1833 domain-containing protein n=1 Tax=Acinetobacter johnsonii TaxID=40214 RepID=A0AAV3WI24_ACIJO|nr:DUF1833 family protein [Acinetobacter johnsonii]WQE00739.1 DUF1833 family protein [Acinetobacter johnsonii]GEK44944.1 hypothetical protein AJO04nite_22020 [Acinetobacter johnsonii]